MKWSDFHWLVPRTDKYVIPFCFLFSKVVFSAGEQCQNYSSSGCSIIFSRGTNSSTVWERMLWSGMEALRKQELATPPLLAVHTPHAGDGVAALWIFTALNQLHEAHFDFPGKRHHFWTRGSRWKRILHLCSAQTLVLCLTVVMGCSHREQQSEDIDSRIGLWFFLCPCRKGKIVTSSLDWASWFA